MHSAIVAPELVSRPLTVWSDPLHLLLPQGKADGAGLVVKQGAGVNAGDLLVAGDDWWLWAPVAGIVRSVRDGEILLQPEDRSVPFKSNGRKVPIADTADEEFLRIIGLLGMGGAAFPAFRKAAAFPRAKTLIVNGVECEPLVTVDRVVLLMQPDLIKAGADALARAMGASRVCLAVANDRELVSELRDLYPYEILPCRARYPAGAERLLVKLLTGRLPAPGTYPGHYDIRVHNVCSVRAVGLGIARQVPVTDRPLSVIAVEHGIDLNLIVPLGIRVGELLSMLFIDFDRDNEILVAGGMMMGRRITPDAHVTQGMTSIFVVSRRELASQHHACIRCGACSVNCPLDLHPAGMWEYLGQKPARRGRAFDAQLDYCFLCGACSVVCPAQIPLAQTFRKAKHDSL